MKKIIILFLSISLVILVSSCGGPKSDIKKMLKMYEDYTEVAVDATKDKVLDENEIEELNEIMKDIEAFGDEMDKKYEKDENATKEAEDYLAEEKNTEIVKKYTKALMSLWDCEGAENLE
jgi:accessory colonization factor AcfC